MAACLMDDNSEKQGIVSILCSDSDRASCKSATSLRRTMSADMPSKKWLSENGFSPIKRVPSSEDIWSSIVSQNAKHDSSAPYVHPLVKRSASSLSKKSLEVCTESLGSETGSDDFSGDPEEEEQQQQKQQKIVRELNNISFIRDSSFTKRSVEAEEMSSKTSHRCGEERGDNDTVEKNVVTHMFLL